MHIFWIVAGVIVLLILLYGDGRALKRLSIIVTVISTVGAHFWRLGVSYG